MEAPLIARSCRAGNFIIVRVDKNSERVPYTIAKADPEKGTLDNGYTGGGAIINEALRPEGG